MVLSAIRTYWPVGGAPVEEARDLSAEYERLEIVAGGERYPGGSTIASSSTRPRARIACACAGPPTRAPDEPAPLVVYETDARALDLFGGIVRGRPDVASAEQPGAAVSITASGLAPIDPRDPAPSGDALSDPWSYAEVFTLTRADRR